MSTMDVPKTMKACQIKEQGSLDVISVHDVDVPQPGPGQVLYKVEYAGVNFIDTCKSPVLVLMIHRNKFS
ncbi:NADPH:quinone reductase [Microbotryomycetes sp. JL201]|nr:NADPH:quinone reductase [Microbotryomycetes sp. JL201]